MEVRPSGIAATRTPISSQRHSSVVNEAPAPSAQISQENTLACNPSPSTTIREPISATVHHMTTVHQKLPLDMVTELLDQKKLRASTAVKNWLAGHFNARPINVDNLLCVDGKLTRYGKINIDGRQFIVGPRPGGEEITAKQGHIYQRLIDAHPNIGAIFGVDKNFTDVQSKTPHRSPTYKHVSEYHRSTGNDGAVERQTLLATRISPEIPQGVICKEFQGFNEHSEKTITSEAFWLAGHEIAQFMKAHPEKIVMICSDQGLSRPCAVAASTVMQLEERAFAQFKPNSAAWEKKLEALKEALKTQRCAASDTHIEASKKAFSANLMYVSLLDEVRTARSWDNQMGDMVPQILPQTSLLDGRGLILQNGDGHFMHRYALDAYGNADEQHDDNIVAQDNDIILYHLIDDQLGNHYEVGNAQGEAWNGKTVVARDGDCLFRALHRALSTDANITINEADETAAILNYRGVVADYFANNIDILAQFTATQNQQIWISEHLGGNIKLEDVQYPIQSEYRTLGILHTDQITLEDIDATAPTSIRLVMRDPQSNTLITDNKYFNNSSIASYHKEQLSHQGVNQAKSLTSTFPVVGFINHQNKVQDIELLLGTTDYTINAQLVDGPQRDRTYHLPILSVAHREISLITDEEGRIIGGDRDGKKIFIDNDTKEPATNAVFFRAKLATNNLSDKKKESLVCYTDLHTFAHKMKYVDASAIHLMHRSQIDPQYKVAFKNLAQLDTTVRKQYPPLSVQQSWYGAMAKEGRIVDPRGQHQHVAARRHALPRAPRAPLATPRHARTAPIVLATACAVEANVISRQRRDDPDTDPGMGGEAQGTRVVPNLFQKMRAYVKDKIHPQQNQNSHNTNTQLNTALIMPLTGHGAHQTPTSLIPSSRLTQQSWEPQSHHAALALHKQKEVVQNKTSAKQEQPLQIDRLTTTSTSSTQTLATKSATDDRKEKSIRILRQKQIDLTRKKEILLAEKSEIQTKIAQPAHIVPALREAVKAKPTNERKILPEKNAAQKALAN